MVAFGITVSICKLAYWNQCFITSGGDLEFYFHLGLLNGSQSGSVWGRAQKGDNATAWPLEFCPGGSCALALALVPDTSISPHMPLVPFQLLPWYQIPERVGLHES